MSSQKYFNDLNYSFANEDSAFERCIVDKLKPKKCISVCGAGARCTALVNKDLEEIFCVDLSKEQLYLAELRFETIRKLDFDSFTLFWGYAPYDEKSHQGIRKKIFKDLSLSNEAKDYLLNLLKENSWKSLLYTGKWEKTFEKFSKVVRRVLGEKFVSELFKMNTIEDQRIFISEKLPRFRWRMIMLVLGNKSLFNRLLYKGSFIKKNVKESYLSYYSKAYKKLMNESLFKQNFFLQLCFLGRVTHKEANPPEAIESNFIEIQKSLKKLKVYYINQDIISFIKTQKNIDFISISDVPSYFSGDVERDFLQCLKPALSPGAVIVNRNYLRVPNSDKDGYSLINDQFLSEMGKEQVQMYRIEVFKREG